MNKNTYETKNLEISKIRPYKKNARKISKEAVRKVAESIKAFGWRQPIVVSEENEIIAGHTRYEAAKSIGLKTVPVHVVTDLSDTQIKALRIADNRTADENVFDFEVLKNELDDLITADFDVALTGFNESELLEISSICEESEIKDQKQSEKKGNENKEAKIKIVLSMSQVELFESAIAATDKTNRAEAVSMICEKFLEDKKCQ